MLTSATLLHEIRRYWIALVDLIYPERCIFCFDRLDFTEELACRDCSNSLPLLKDPRCTPRSSRQRYVHSGAAVFAYEGVMKDFFHRVKFDRKQWHLKFLRRHLQNARLPLPLSEYDALVPVPLDRERSKVRQFNQSALIAKMLAAEHGTGRVQPLLIKIRNTEPQSLLNRSDRLTNVRDAFQLKKGARIAGKKILLVDDIVTTGATVNECARCLRSAGAKRVDFFSVARAVTT